jgi:hypothetical protein
VSPRPRDTIRDANSRRPVGIQAAGGPIRVAGGVWWGWMRQVAAAFDPQVVRSRPTGRLGRSGARPASAPARGAGSLRWDLSGLERAFHCVLARRGRISRRHEPPRSILNSRSWSSVVHTTPDRQAVAAPRPGPPRRRRPGSAEDCPDVYGSGRCQAAMRQVGVCGAVDLADGLFHRGDRGRRDAQFADSERDQ